MKQQNPGSIMVHQRMCCLAEQEFSAFYFAVARQYGLEQARRSADEWLEELLGLDYVCPSGVEGLREVTIATSVRLAARLAVPALAASRDQRGPPNTASFHAVS